MNIRHLVIISVWLLSMRSASAQFTIGETEKAIEAYKRSQILAELQRLKSPITASSSIESDRAQMRGEGLGVSAEAIGGAPEPNQLSRGRPRPTWESLSSEFAQGVPSSSPREARQAFPEFDSRMPTIGEEVIGEPMARAWHGEASHPPIAIGASDFPIQYVRIGGLLQVDAGIVNQDAAAVASVGDWTNNATVRRARLRTDANLTDNVAVGLEFDFAFLNRVNPTEAYIELNQTLPLGDVRVGLFRQPIGLDALTDDSDVTLWSAHYPSHFPRSDRLVSDCIGDHLVAAAPLTLRRFIFQRNSTEESSRMMVVLAWQSVQRDYWIGKEIRDAFFI